MKFKRDALNAINECVLRGDSIRTASDKVGIPHWYYKRWRKTVFQVDQLLHTKAWVPFNIKGDSRKIHPGPKSQLNVIENDLTRSLFELREQGLQVNTRTLRKEAARLSTEFRGKTRTAKISCVNRYILRAGLSHRVSTHVAQKNHNETTQESLHFLSLMGQKIIGMDPDDIVNMDQTPIPYSYHSNRTLEKKGVKTIHVRSSTTDTKRATLAATVTASGKLLKPMLIFKGQANGRIERNEFQTYPENCVYAMQPKAWMDEKMMHKWIDDVLIPWKQTRNPDVVPLLILDAYRVHMMGSIVNRIQSLGIEVQHIPAGCTYLCQPVDIGINRPIKKAMMEQWEDWMYAGGGVVEGVAKTPSRKLVAEWIIDTYKVIMEETARNAWRKKGFEWIMH